MKIGKVNVVSAAVLFVTLWACQAYGAADEKIQLKLNLKAGQKFETTITTDQKIKQTINGNPMDVNQLMTMQMISEVLDVNSAGINTIKITYGDIKGKMDTPQGSIVFDTSKPDSNDPNQPPQVKPMTDMWNALKGSSLKMKVDSYGKVKGCEGIDQMVDTMASKMSKNDPNAAAAMKGMFKNMYNDKTMGEMGNNMFGCFPQAPVGVGDVWDNTLSMGSDAFPMDFDVTYMLSSIKDGIAAIEMTSKIDMGKTGGKLIDLNGMKANLLMTGVMTGQQKVNQANGWMSESKTKYSMNGSMKLEPSPQMPQGMTMPMAIEGNVTAKSKPIN